MTFAAHELSIDAAKPIELFQVHYSGRSWYYTSADINVEFGGNIHVAVPCSHAAVEQQISGEKFALPITFPHDIPLGELFVVQPPSEIVSMTILVANSDEPGVYVVLWKGRIVNIEWKYPWVELVTESIASSMKRVGLRRRYSLNCGYPLYSVKCGVSRESNRVNGTVTALNGTLVTVALSVAKPDGFFAGGLVVWGNAESSNSERRMIFTSEGSTGVLKLTTPVVGLVVGQAVALYPGCDHSISTCGSKFNNQDNFGGMPYIPQANPFAGSTVF